MHNRSSFFALTCRTSDRRRLLHVDGTRRIWLDTAGELTPVGFLPPERVKITRADVLAAVHL